MSTKEKSGKAEPKEAKVDKAGEITAEPVPAAVAPVAPRTTKTMEIPGLIEFLLIAATIISAVYLVGVYNPTEIRITPPRTSRLSCDRGSWSLEHMKPQPVQRFRWEPSLPFAAQLSLWREPVILTETFVTKWKAIERWASDDYLRSKPEMATMEDTMVVRHCQMNPSAADKPLAAAGLVHAPENFYSLNATSDLFFSRFNDPEEDQYWYWYGKVRGSLVDDIQPSDDLWVDPNDEQQFGLYMWLSGPDIGPWWHYDQDHNFYVQVAGTKRFILVPPWETPNMHPYPHVHPRSHKSQVNFDKPDLSKTPNYENIKESYVAELEPGEVLYIPPYWWHHVRSHVRSVSLASWSQSGIYRVMRFGLYKRQFVMDSLTQGSPQRLAAFRYMLLSIARKLYGPDASFFTDLVTQRWEPTRKEIESNLPVDKRIEDDTLTKARLCYPISQLDEELRDKIDLDAKAAVDAFENCQTRAGSGNTGIGKDRRDMQAIRDIEFGDFTDFMLAGEVGAENALAFLDHCLDSTAFEAERAA